MSTETQQYDEQYNVEEWNRSIPPAGYIKLGALRYGIRLSKLNAISTNNKNNNNSKNVDNQSANKQHQHIAMPISTSTSLIMSPSSETTAATAAVSAINGKSDFCNDGCCCCISSTSSNAISSKNYSRNAQLSTMSAKNRITSSPSSASSSSSSQKQQQQQQKSEQLKISSSVSSSNFKREASPTVCCYYINNNRSQSQISERSSYINNNNINNNNNKRNLNKNCENFQYLKKPLNNQSNQNSALSDSVPSEYSKKFANFNNNKNRSAQPQQKSEKKNYFVLPSSSSSSSSNAAVTSFNDKNNDNHKSIDINDDDDDGNDFGKKCATREYFLREKIKRFENTSLISSSACNGGNKNRPLNNNSIKQQSEFLAIASPDDHRPVYQCISENNNNSRKNDKNSNFSTFLINRDESRQLKAPAQRGTKFIAQNEKCKLKYVNDSNNNQVESLRNSQNCIGKSVVALAAKPPPSQHLVNNNSDDTKITRVIIRHLEPSVNETPINDENLRKNNLLDDNDFSFIDSSSQSVSRSSSTSFASDEIDENSKNLRKHRIPKISNRINNNNNYNKRQESCLSAKNICANSNNRVYEYPINDRTNDTKSIVYGGCSDRELRNINNNHQISIAENEQPQQKLEQLKVSIDHSIPDNSIIMEKGRRNTLQKFGFGRKASSSSASTSPDRKPSSSKTERLRELTEKLKGNKTGSFKLSSRSVSPPAVSPPVPPPLPLIAPIPPPRKFKRNSTTASVDNLSCSEHQPDLQHIGKSKSVEPSSLLSGQLTRQLAKLLRPNTSASNLEALNRSNEKKSTKDDELATKLSRPESRTIIGSYTQRNIIFRSASFSQADAKSGKYVKSDIQALKNSIRHKSMERSPSPQLILGELEFDREKYPLKSECSINLDTEDKFSDQAESPSKRNSDIDTIDEEPIAESLAEQHSIESQLNVVQASEMTLEPLIEEEPPLLSVSPKYQKFDQLQQATTCLIPIPVFECVEKEWTHLPENGGEEFCQPISEEVLPQAKVIENFIEIRLNGEMQSDSNENLNPEYNFEPNFNALMNLDNYNSLDNLNQLRANNNFISLDNLHSNLNSMENINAVDSLNSINDKISSDLDTLVDKSTNRQILSDSSIEKQDSIDTHGTESQSDIEHVPIVHPHHHPIIPEVELNNVALQLDEITEKLKENIQPNEEVCNVVKTQIPQSNKEELVAQKSFESVEEIRISPEIQEVLETVAETLNEEHKFLTNAIGNANINIVNLICPDLELSSSDRGTPDGSKFDLLKAIESSPEPGSFDKGSFDKSDTEFTELTVRKRHSNDANSGSDKSSPNASPNSNLDDKRKLDKSRRRKGIYIQWPAVERSQDTSFEYATNEDIYGPPKHQRRIPSEERKLKKSHGLDFSFSEPTIQRQSESIGSEPYTPDSEYGSQNKPPLWPKSSRRQSLTYQSSDERDDQGSILSPQNKQYRTTFPRSESISDNESDRGSSRDRISSSPAPGNDADLKRYSKRPLRGPYGQMLEAEMKKPTKVHYDGILEELCRSDSVKKSNCSLDSNESSGGFFSRSKARKGGGGDSLPVPMHQRAGSSPVPLIETPSPDPLPISHKKYPSNIDQRMVGSDHLSLRSEGVPKKLSLDSHLSVDQKSPKRASSDISDKHSKKNYSDKFIQKRNYEELRVSTTPSEKAFVLNTPDTPKNMAATPELLAELLKGSSEKILTDQTSQNKKHQMRNSSSSNSSGLPLAVLNSLNNLDTRTHVVVELFNTEKSYVESLQTIVLKYLNPLKLPEYSGIVDVQIVEEIFFMVPSILNIHENYLEELKKRLDAWDPMQCIGDVYFNVFSKPIVLETYIAFVNNWNKAKDAIRTTKTTKPAFAKFLEAMAREHKGKLSLDNLLIKPIQKFPNYELIFQRLIKHTDSDHPDYTGCQDALKLVHEILVQLNCKEREALENGQREATLRELENVIEGITDLVSSDRAFVSFELVSMPSGQAGRKERGFFLFTDLLVITSIKKRSGTYRKPNSMPGSFSSTLDTNKYKFLTKIPLDDLEIVKSKDENVRRIMKEIEHLIEDSNKLQQILEISTNLRCPHQILEESIRDLQLNVQRQLSERQANDSQLNVLELNVNGPSGTQNMSIVFSKPEKRTQWEETFNETKQKLIASIERFQVPEFIASVPIRKTRAGLQFTCAAATLGTQKDVWVCNSDGYVGQVCVLSLNQPEPTVTSCNGVCNARILCVTSVPGNPNEYRSSSMNNLNNSSIITNEDQNRSSLLSISNSSTISNKTMSVKSSSTQSDSNIQLDSSSSSDSEPEASTATTVTVQDRSVSPSIISNTSSQQQQHQQQLSTSGDDGESQMWLGTEDGYIHVYNCTDNIRIKKNKIKIQHVSAVNSILYMDKRVFVSLANGDICVYSRKDSGWNTNNPLVLSIGSSVTSPVTKLLNVYGKLWCAIANYVKILNTSTLQVENNAEISSESKPISNMTLLNQHVWISLQNSATILCCNVNNLKVICEVNLAPAVNKMLSNCDNIIQQHKAACLRVTSLLACKDIIWVGTSAGVLLTILAQNIGKGTPVVTGLNAVLEKSFDIYITFFLIKAFHKVTPVTCVS
ncbi:hypothetical protein ACKWTF_009632 [Chironomus riparius]